MKKFIIHAQSGKYEVQMRNSYVRITSEKKLIEFLQNTIDRYSSMPTWKNYADKCQELLNERNYFRLDQIFGIFGKTKKVG